MKETRSGPSEMIITFCCGIYILLTLFVSILHLCSLSEAEFTAP